MRIGRTILSVIVVCGFWTPSAAQDGDGPARIEISGTSTVRGWTCPVDGVMSTRPASTAPPLPGLPSGVGPVTIRVQVAEIECPEEQMKEHLQEAMNAPEHPEIVYELQTYAVDGDSAHATGEITIHGVTKPVSLDIEFVESPDGMRGVGQTQLNMTEFGLTPPSLWLGMLNVGEIVQIEFDVPFPSGR